MSQRVWLLLILLADKPEKLAKEIKTISVEIRRWRKPAMDGGGLIGYVIRTEETAKELVDRLRPYLGPEFAANFWCLMPGREIECRHGSVDLLPSFVGQAYDDIRESPNPKDVRRPQISDVFKHWGVEDSERSTAIKMALHPRKRDEPQDPNKR